MSKVHRRYTAERVEVREGETTPVIAGYAAVFNQEAVIGGMFREVIRPGAFRHVVANPPDDLKALFNHDASAVIGAVSSGTLRISEDDHGLRYEVDINTDDPQAMSVLAKIRRGDVNKSSFGFMVPEGGQEIQREAGQLPLRQILRADLFDVSPVSYPAYPGTSSMALRSAEELAADEAVASELAAAPATSEADVMSATILRQKRQAIIEGTL